MSAAILVVEDEPGIQEVLKFNLAQQGYAVRVACDGEQALSLSRDALPDLVLLDWMLPGMSGLEVARRMRADARLRTIPIIMLTARAEERDKVQGLDIGADDYITKPFSPRELMARIKAVLRRRAPELTDDPVEAAGLKLEPASHRAFAGGKALDLGPTEFRLLHFFMTHPERVYSRAQLLDQVWGDHVFVEERTVDVHIRRLRGALETSGHRVYSRAQLLDQVWGDHVFVEERTVDVHIRRLRGALEASGHDRLIQTVRGAGYRLSTTLN